MTAPETQQPRTAMRFPLQKPIRLRASTLPLVVGPTGRSRVVDGYVQDISSGGLCLLVARRLKISELLMGEISFPGTRATIPTLLQVRWLHKQSLRTGYRVGLHFVLQGGIAQALQSSTRFPHLTSTVATDPAHITQKY